MSETMLSPLKAAKLLGVSARLVQQWAAERKIDSHRIGRLVRVPAREVQRILDASFVPARQRRR
jgi:excisionase family DNA binding protein